MKKILVEGHICIGPHFSDGEFLLIKRNLEQQNGLDTLADLLGVVGNPLRLKIVYLLFAHNELCVCDLAEILKVTDSAISQHLRKLKDKHVVKSRKDSQSVYYSLEEKKFTNLLTEYLVLPEVKKKYDFIEN